MGFFEDLVSEREKATASGWTIGFITEDKRPVATYDCKGCHTKTYFDCPGNGAVLVARCCVKAEPFPPSMYDHLSLKPKWAPVPAEGTHAGLGIRALLHKIRAISRGDFFAR
jgi:hypothetical protein